MSRRKRNTKRVKKMRENYAKMKEMEVREKNQNKITGNNLIFSSIK